MQSAPTNPVGRPRKPATERKGRHVLYLPPTLARMIERSAGTGRGAISQEIVRILAAHYTTAKR